MTEDFMQNCEDELYGILLKLRTKEDCRALLEDLCTYKEVENMAMRAHAAKLCMEGKTYTEIIKETKLSSTTISRIARCVTHGSGGYRKFVSPDAPEAAAPEAEVPEAWAPEAEAPEAEDASAEELAELPEE
ncbi:MAG: YerC/YecD family TrpR-related protein [Clostridia bacterium]|nr:YerC/YecD family TrpR-related protein [Clostridia bacterium]